MNTRQTTCCFTGNRPEKLPWGSDEAHPDCVRFKQLLEETLESLAAEGYRHFIGGMARGGDIWFAEAVLRLKDASLGPITLEAAVPCPEQAKYWCDADRKRYEGILARCDTVTAICPHYTPYCMMKRNRYMVDAASVVVCLLRAKGGTQSTVDYARKSGLRVIEL